MKADTLRQAIDFALEDPNVKNHIAALEAQPNYFRIFQIGAEVRDVRRNIIRVYINFHEAGRPNYTSKEDLVIDLQGTTYSTFRTIGISQAQI